MILRDAEQEKSHRKKHAIFKAFLRKMPDDPSLVVDAGASFGCWSYMARHRWEEATLLCIEPNEEHRPQLLANAAAPIIPAALLPPPAPRTVPFSFKAIKGTCTPEQTKWPVEGGREIEVPVILPALLPRRISLLRLNIAGAEGRLLPTLPPCDYIWLENHDPGKVTFTNIPPRYELIQRVDRYHLLKRKEAK